jgi:hypothetical protein
MTLIRLWAAWLLVRLSDALARVARRLVPPRHRGGLS